MAANFEAMEEKTMIRDHLRSPYITEKTLTFILSMEIHSRISEHRSSSMKNSNPVRKRQLVHNLHGEIRLIEGKATGF